MFSQTLIVPYVVSIYPTIVTSYHDINDHLIVIILTGLFGRLRVELMIKLDQEKQTETKHGQK